MIQCKDSIVILRRSEDRRRICNLSPNRSFAYAQDDKESLSGIRTQPAGHAWRQPDVCRPPPAKAAARTAQKSRDAPAIVAKTIVPHPPPHSFKRLLFAPVAGYRYSATGALSVIGARGYYWSSSSYAAGNLNAGDMDFTDVRVVPLGYPNRRRLWPCAASSICTQVVSNVRPRRIPAVPARRLRVLRENPCVPNFRARRPVPGDGRRPSFRRLQPVCTRPCGQG